MSDIRRCDGPDCDKEADLHDGVLIGQMGELVAEDFIVLECTMGRVYHFHNSLCLRKWSLNSLREDAGVAEREG
jgi:hypothetical protein